MPQTEVRVFRQANGRLPVVEWLDHLERTEPRAYQKCLQRILMLEQLGYEMRRPNADSLGRGIYELRAQVGTVHYRILYFYYGRNTAVLSHGLTKEGKVPPENIDKAVRHEKLVRANPEVHLADWGDD